MTRDAAGVAKNEYARLRALLDVCGVGQSGCSFEPVRSAVTEWMLKGSGDAADERFLLGWECSWNPNDGDSDHSHPEPPDGVPAGPLFNVVFLWNFDEAGEVGVELWYPADDDWDVATREPDWDANHSINVHGWGYPGPGAAEFLAVVFSSPQIDVAARKAPAAVRAFGTGSPDLVMRCG